MGLSVFPSGSSSASYPAAQPTLKHTITSSGTTTFTTGTKLIAYVIVGGGGGGSSPQQWSYGGGGGGSGSLYIGTAFVPNENAVVVKMGRAHV